MRLLPRVLLRWQEPKVLQYADYTRGRRRFFRMLPVLVLAPLLLIWFASGDLAPEFTGRLYAVVGLLILFIYALLWVHKVFPSYVEVTETGISRSVTRNVTRIWKFEDLGHCEIGKTRVGNEAPTVLVIVTKKGERFMIGIADSISTAHVQTILTRMGVKVITTDEGDGAR